jgi:K+-sensing histidine kinase KdpD
LTSVHELDPATPNHADLRVIVCAVEANDEAETILKTAGLIAQVWGAKLTIAHMTGSRLNMLQMNANDLDIDALKREFRVTGAVRTLQEDVVEGIRCTAVQESADLVIVGRGHNRGAISRLWSDLYEIIRESPCPVLSV